MLTGQPNTVHSEYSLWWERWVHFDDFLSRFSWHLRQHVIIASERTIASYAWRIARFSIFISTATFQRRNHCNYNGLMQWLPRLNSQKNQPHSMHIYNSSSSSSSNNNNELCTRWRPAAALFGAERMADAIRGIFRNSIILFLQWFYHLYIHKYA